MSSAFDIVKPRVDMNSRQRVGVLRIKDKDELPTPNHLALGTRGFVPHLTSDVLDTQTNILAVYAGFEDFAESLPKSPIHFSFPCGPAESPLKAFTAFPKSRLIVLGPRRGNAVPSNNPNTYTSLNICSSVGYRELEIPVYLEAIAKSRPDVIIAPIDIEFGRPILGLKRREKMVERSTAWVRSFEVAIKEAEALELSPIAWVPILPLESEEQATYLQHLEEFGEPFVKGIVVYDASSTISVPELLKHLPLISLTNPRTPHDILRLVSLGVDIIAAPFVTATAEAGIALDFDFPPKIEGELLVLGEDLWQEAYATQATPLNNNCSCYTCMNHHRAYIQHLLSAKEMLAWVLLQIHNHHVIDRFFKGIRESIAQNKFEADVIRFTSTYLPDLPVFKGQGPRRRGYQAWPGANAKKLNLAPFRKMDQESARHVANLRERGLENRVRKPVNLDAIEVVNFDAFIGQEDENEAHYPKDSDSQ